MILLSIALAFAANYLPVSVKKITPTLFWFETIAILAFGVSWFVKGRSLLPLRRRKILRDTQRDLLEIEPDAAQKVQVLRTQAGDLTAQAGPPTDQELAQLLASGLPVHDVASKLDISPQRVSELAADAT